MELSYEYTKKRKEFGKHVAFTDTEPTILCDLRPTHERDNEWIERNMTTSSFDCTQHTSVHEVNTEVVTRESKGMHHTEGGFPKEVNTKEFQEKQRFIRRLENEPTFQKQFSVLARTCERAIMQSHTIDLYEEYFGGADVDHASEPPSMKIVNAFRDPTGDKRSIAQIAWHPEHANTLAVAYAPLDFQRKRFERPGSPMASQCSTARSAKSGVSADYSTDTSRPNKRNASSYVWDVNNPSAPKYELRSLNALCCLVFNPKHTDILCGGSHNGLVAVWDLRKSYEPTDTSAIETSHHDPVYDVAWTQSRTGTECVSVSTDGQILWWDTRKLSAPVDSMKLQNDGDESVFGASALAYRSDAGATRFLVGCEQGNAVLLERKAKKDQSSQKSIRSIFGFELPGSVHLGPVYQIERNAFNPKVFMTVGDWRLKMWSEDLKSPIMDSLYDTPYLTAACWSPTRPGVFLATTLDGCIDLWDLYYKQNEPVFPTRVGESPLSAISVQNSGKLVAVGARDGTTTLLKLSDSLVTAHTNEKPAITALFEREAKRGKLLEVRHMLKRKEQEKLDAKRAKAATPAAAAATEDKGKDDERAKEDEAGEGEPDVVEEKYSGTSGKLGTQATSNNDNKGGSSTKIVSLFDDDEEDNSD